MAQYGVIFDMDGVLVDSYQAHFESWRRLARRHGLDVTEEQFAHEFGRTSREIVRDLWGTSVGEADIPSWDAFKEQEYRNILLEDFPAMVGATELLEALHEAGFAMAIGSSGPAENIRVVVDRLPGARHIAATVCGMDVAEGKPHPQVFLLAAERLGLAPARCAVVEDAPAGIEAARRAGMTAIAITGTAQRDRLAKAHTIVDRLTELSPDRIRELIEGNLCTARG
jgi:beta-phosphoglucomutase